MVQFIHATYFDCITFFISYLQMILSFLLCPQLQLVAKAKCIDTLMKLFLTYLLTYLLTYAI